MEFSRLCTHCCMRARVLAAADCCAGPTMFADAARRSKNYAHYPSLKQPDQCTLHDKKGNARIQADTLHNGVSQWTVLPLR